MNSTVEYNYLLYFLYTIKIILKKNLQIDELGNEYWEARELMLALEYSKWEHFVKVINKAKVSCNLSGYDINDHFPVKGKIINSDVAKKEVIDYKLSRYACYLIVQNANPARHKSVALGQQFKQEKWN